MHDDLRGRDLKRLTADAPERSAESCAVGEAELLDRVANRLLVAARAVDRVVESHASGACSRDGIERELVALFPR